MSWQPPGHDASGWQPDGWQPDDAGSNPPVLVGSIPNISETENTGTHQHDLSAYFTGADTYAIAPAVETGWSFDTNTGVLEIDTDALGTFGPFIVTATNANGDTDSNAFSVAVVVAVAATEQSSGGYAFENDYAAELQRRKARERRRKRLEEESERIESEVDREIAQLLREQEAKDDRREELKRLEEIAKAHAEALRVHSRAVAKAFEAALKKGTFAAIDRLDRELKKAHAEEEEFMTVVLLATLH